MEKSKLIPIVSKNLIVSKFDKNSFYLHQTEFNYRLKISKESYDLLKLADGVNNLKNIQNIIDEDEVTVAFLEDFYYKQMAKYGIVENEKVEVEPIGKPSYLRLSFIVLPASVVDKITPYLQFLFVPKLMYPFLIGLVVFLSFITLNYYEVLLSFNLSKISWVYFGLMGFISVTFHEFGHASSARYFGAKHGGIGGGFYFFTPVYFADVSDIWKLSRDKRIIVNLSGIYWSQE